MKRIEKKLWPEGFQAVLDGRKSYELRLADFVAEEGDVLVLREWDPKTSAYTGRSIEKRIGHVGCWRGDELEMYWTKSEIEKHGLQILSLLDP